MTIAVTLNLTDVESATALKVELERSLANDTLSEAHRPVLESTLGSVDAALQRHDLETFLADEKASFVAARAVLADEAKALTKFIVKSGYTQQGLSVVRDFTLSYQQGFKKVPLPVDEGHFDYDTFIASNQAALRRAMATNMGFIAEQAGGLHTALKELKAATLERLPLPADSTQAKAAQDCLKSAMRYLTFVGQEGCELGSFALKDAEILLDYGTGFMLDDKARVARLFRNRDGQPSVDFSEAVVKTAERFCEEETAAWVAARYKA